MYTKIHICSSPKWQASEVPFESRASRTPMRTASEDNALEQDPFQVFWDMNEHISKDTQLRVRTLRIWKIYGNGKG